MVCAVVGQDECFIVARMNVAAVATELSGATFVADMNGSSYCCSRDEYCYHCS